MRTFSEDKAIERALVFLVHAFEESGHNPKPVILHSARVAMYLESKGYSVEIVVAALLHDLLEDADLPLKSLEEEFGSEVAGLVSANSYDPASRPARERDAELLLRCKAGGKNAMIVKAADILDNSRYYRLADPGLSGGLIEKMKIFLDLTKAEISSEIVWKDLESRYRALSS